MNLPREDDSEQQERTRALCSWDEIMGRFPRLAFESRNDCVLLGPSGSGKTALLSSFARACEESDPRGIRAVPLDALAVLAGNAALYRSAGGDWPATQVRSAYPLQVTLDDQDFLLRVQDHPGGLFFPFSASGRSLLEGPERQDFNAPCVVFCINAVSPQPALWRVSLPPLVDFLASISGEPTHLIPRLGSPEDDFPRLLTPKRQLPYKRILVCLNRIDSLVEEGRRILDASRVSPRFRLARRLSGEDLALRIDPIRLLQDQVGPILGSLRSAKTPDAQLAVGLTSAWGLRSPKPFSWSPFGVREALLFLATGQCTGPVVGVGPDTALEAGSEGWTELPCSPRRARRDRPGDEQ